MISPKQGGSVSESHSVRKMAVSTFRFYSNRSILKIERCRPAKKTRLHENGLVPNTWTNQMSVTRSRVTFCAFPPVSINIHICISRNDAALPLTTSIPLEGFVFWIDYESQSGEGVRHEVHSSSSLNNNYCSSQ